MGITFYIRDRVYNWLKGFHEEKRENGGATESKDSE